MSHAFSLLNEKPYNISSCGRGGVFPTISCCVQPPVEKETQKPSFWEQVLGENILVYLKSPRRRREQILIVKKHVPCIVSIKRKRPYTL